MKISQRFTFAALVLSNVALADAALAAGDNCQNVKDGVTQEWGAVEWAPLAGCFAGTPTQALQEARAACVRLLLTQGVLGQPEQREVHLWLGGPPSATLEWAKTYLGYCRGNKPAATLDPAKAQAEQKELEARMK